jgi:putative transposase
VWWQLRRDGIPVARCTVARLIRSHGVTGVRRAKKQPAPRSAAIKPIGPHLDRDFTAAAPNRLSVADFTYVMTWSGIVYVVGTRRRWL